MARMPSWLATGGIVVLVVADVTLVSLAALHVRGVAGQSTGPEEESPNGRSEPTTRPNRDPSDKPALNSGPILLDVSPNGTVVRAARGDCGSPTDTFDPEAVVEISTDGGRSFASAGLGDPIADVLRVEAGDGTDIFLVGVDPTCTVAIYSSSDAGATWEASAGTAGAWHLARVGNEEVHTPNGPERTGCEVLALSAYSESGARVLCQGGELRGTASGGASWVGLGSLTGGVDITYATPANGWALATTEACPAAVLRTADGGADWREVACLDIPGEPQAIGGAPGLVAAQVGGQLVTSSNSGATFVRP